MKKGRQNGFTLIEMMVTIAVAGILLAVAIPNMGAFIKNNRLTSAANDLLHSLQRARTEAIKRDVNVVVCGTSDPDAADTAITCSYGNFTGWFVFVDTSGDWQHQSTETVLEKHALVNSTVSVKADGNYIFTYAPTGFAPDTLTKTPTANVVFCDSRGNVASGTSGTVTYSTARALLIASKTGRARVSNVLSDSSDSSYSTVTNALSTIGSTCP